MGAACVDDGHVHWIGRWILNLLAIVEESLTLQCPCLEIVLIVLETSKAGCAANYLSGVVSTKECIRPLAPGLLRSDTEADHCAIDGSTIFHDLEEVKMPLAFISVRREPKDTIRLWNKALSLAKGKEAEYGTPLFFE